MPSLGRKIAGKSSCRKVVWSERLTGLFWQLFIGLSVVFAALWQVSLFASALVENRQIVLSTTDATQRAKEIFSDAIEIFVDDLMILASARSVTAWVPDDHNAHARLTWDFLTFAREKASIAQLRLVDGKGMEFVRIDRRGSQVVAVDRNELQDKSSRYYFKHAVRLPRRGVYVSALDLNVEHGEVETPWNPTLRLATPIIREDGKTTAVVIMNFAIGQLLDKIGKLTPRGVAPLQMLNADGYWLAGVPKNRLWGFMFGRDETLARSDPSVWAAVTAHEQGTIDHDGTHFVYRTIRPVSLFAERRKNKAFYAEDVEWKFLGAVPGVGVGDLWRPDQIPIGLLGLVVAFVIAFGWSSAITARRAADASRTQAEKEVMRVERMASLGSLVAGLAHELNTPIGNAVTVASTLSEQAGRFEEAIRSGQIRRAVLDDFVTGFNDGTAIMLRGLNHAADLIRRFKQVAIDQTSERRRDFGIAELIADVVSTIGPQFKHGRITLETEVESRATLDSYPGPLGQVLINLIVNAQVHGFAADQPGQIIVAARDLGKEEIEITIRDTGNGIPESMLARIFEPFFTTRLGEGGSGLGLSIAFNIVTNVLGGRIHADNAENGGAIFTLNVPSHAP